MPTQITIQTGLSTTTKSAQSKKCRLLKSVRAHITHPTVALAILKADPLLQQFLTPQNISDAYNNITTTKTRSNLTTLTITIPD